MDEDYTIFVGGKPFMNYVTAVVMQFTTRGAEKVVIKSRGKFISRAVDVAEVVKSRFLKNQVDVADIQIGSEEFKNNEGRLVHVSTLDIIMSKTDTNDVSVELSETQQPPATETIVEETKPVEAAPVETPPETPALAEEVSPTTQ